MSFISGWLRENFTGIIMIFLLVYQSEEIYLNFNQQLEQANQEKYEGKNTKKKYERNKDDDIYKQRSVREKNRKLKNEG